jgi:DNA polymerase-3 subunit gamma/tau
MSKSPTDSPEKGPEKGHEPPAYRVLARKYRPSGFDELIGQMAMVQTLKNAFRLNRIAQGFMLTGVRGVGKTTTARILARALNYEGEGIDGPTIDMPVLGPHCQAIMESRHVDVLEMDAASHTGVDDIREIIESTRYKPIAARYKVYIVDEVHMLSKNAFNALLKTLEEPPPHVKFIFATTEVQKVPVTVLSRCQRFDLKRIEIEELATHFKGIAGKEGVRIDEAALALIARAAEGSVRDGLSLLDQAIAHASDGVKGEDVRAMLGLSDRQRVFDLLEKLLKGDAAGAIRDCEALYADGAEPSRILVDLADATHLVTRRKVLDDKGGEALSEAERQRSGELAAKLAMPALSRCWQMLVKGIDECQKAPSQLAAVEMVLVRIAYAAELPSPEELARMVESGRAALAAPGAAATAASAPARGSTAGGPTPGTATPGGGASVVTMSRGGGPATAMVAVDPKAQSDERLSLAGFADIAELIGERGGLMLKLAFEEHVRPVAFEPGSIEIALTEDAPKGLANDLKRVLQEATGVNWLVAVSAEAGGETLAEERERQRRAELDLVRDHPLVKAALKLFPDAQITDIRAIDNRKDREGEA